MVKTTIYCDRCGKIIPDKECRDNHGYRIVRSINSERLDLCQDCYDSLHKWMRSKVVMRIDIPELTYNDSTHEDITTEDAAQKLGAFRYIDTDSVTEV